MAAVADILLLQYSKEMNCQEIQGKIVDALENLEILVLNSANLGSTVVDNVAEELEYLAGSMDWWACFDPIEKILGDVEELVEALVNAEEEAEVHALVLVELED